MALVEATLKSGLLTAFQTNAGSSSTTYSSAATQIANAYASYAVAGMFGTGTIPSLSTQATALANTLATAFASHSAATTASAFATGLATFWTGVVIAGGQPGATIGCPGASALTATLTALFQSYPATMDACATSLATALDTATKTVTATVTNLAPPPPTVVLPIA